MSVSWIKVRSNLVRDPRVVCIAETLNMDRFAIVGRLVAFWVWADQYTEDGQHLTVTSGFIDEEFVCMGFASALRKVGWLEGQEGDITIPRFEEHNGDSSKKRFSNALRQKKFKERGKVTDPRYISNELRAEVFRLDGYTCVYCGRKEGDRSLTESPNDALMGCDHVIPFSKGGPTTVDNLVCCCNKCNMQKGNRGLVESGMKVTRERERSNAPSSSLSPSSVLDGGVQGRKAPTVAEWTEFCRGAHSEWNPKDVDSAWQHFQSQGWKRGKTPIADWRAAAEKCYAGWKELGSQGKITPPPAWDGPDGPPGWQAHFKKNFPPDQFSCPRYDEGSWRDVPREVRADIWRDMTKGAPRA